jgi:alcohol dehydrogenase class IV
MLPHTLAAMRPRAPGAIAALAAALGCEPGELPARLEALGGGPRRLGEMGADRGRIDAAVEAIMARSQLADTPAPPGAGEVRELIEAAW